MFFYDPDENDERLLNVFRFYRFDKMNKYIKKWS